MSTQNRRNPIAVISALTLLFLPSGPSAFSDTELLELVPLLANTANDNKVVETFNADLGKRVQNVELEANRPIEIRFTYKLTKPIGTKGDFSINLADTLKNVTLSSTPIAANDKAPSTPNTLRLLASAFIKDAFAASSTQVTTYVSYAGDPNVCSSRHKFGPYSIAGAIGDSLSTNTPSVSPTDEVVDIVNAGAFELCIRTTPPIDAYVSVSGVAVDFQACEPATVDIADTRWSGNYQCDNFGTPDEASSISLRITRNADGSYRYRDDGGATYDGNLCGNELKFSGGKSGYYTESGTLVFSDDQNATKTSTWNSIPPGSSGGNCRDTLRKI